MALLQWINLRSVHLVARIIAGTCLTAFAGWHFYKHYTGRDIQDRDPSRTFKKNQGGDSLSNPDDDDDDQDTEGEGENDEPTSDGSSDFADYAMNSEDETDAKVDDTVDIEDFGKSTEKSLVSNNLVRLNKKSFRSSNQKKSHTQPDYSLMKEEQLTDKLRGDLSRQGYKLIESHSAVKMCRWTKNSMRGRGGCYKHTFYGIKSYQCMEMTPNLACASKCTFCWRHHKNPVGTEWRWKMDPPDVIVSKALKSHEEMIKQLKGVPGVTKSRFLEAQNVRHCALSLVGEPIFYPRINELLEILHGQLISTFLVTNAQFPDAMRHLIPVTQLYVSIDAPNKETLKKIDRPLYRDFWDRYLECLRIISEKKQRTVFRLTLVQKANMEDLKGYAELVNIGQPDFIEIKGVTYCGTSKANKLTMENVPWHEQVVEFAQELLKLLPTGKYELACEHSHSNCTLLANTKFKKDDKWYTWIDYEKFFQLIKSRVNFTSLDYMAETPDWALFGSTEGGFDPEHMRWIRKDHKLKLLKERLAAQQQNCASENCCQDKDSQAQMIELNS